jgi:hypothetical protein
MSTINETGFSQDTFEILCDTKGREVIKRKKMMKEEVSQGPDFKG